MKTPNPLSFGGLASNTEYGSLLAFLKPAARRAHVLPQMYGTGVYRACSVRIVFGLFFPLVAIPVPEQP
jgi:hypothetical protein